MDEWQLRLRNALDVGAVLEVARDFIGDWSAEELHRLPHGCQPPPMTHAEEVADYALTLIQTQYKTLAEGNELERMATFFAHASARLSVIATNAEALGRRVALTNLYFDVNNEGA